MNSYNKIKKLNMTSLCISAAMTICLLLISCGEASTTETNTSEVTLPQIDAQTSEYEYQTLDMNGETFTILNTAQPYNFYSALDFDEVTGDTLDDSIFERNRNLEEKYNFKLEINEDYEMEKAAAALQTAVLAGDDIYDAAFIRDYYMTTALTEGYLQNLDNIPGLQLDKAWWDTASIDNARVGTEQKALFAMSDISLVDFEGTVVTFFNEDMLDKIGLEAPYQLVRDGTWCFDDLLGYMKAGANLNGDSSYSFDENGSSIYGMAGWQHAYNALITSAGVKYITKDTDGNLTFGLDNELFYNTAIKISQSFAEDGV